MGQAAAAWAGIGFTELSKGAVRCRVLASQQHVQPIDHQYSLCPATTRKTSQTPGCGSPEAVERVPVFVEVEVAVPHLGPSEW